VLELDAFGSSREAAVAGFVIGSISLVTAQLVIPAFAGGSHHKSFEFLVHKGASPA
jgi:hypothetical protein